VSTAAASLRLSRWKQLNWLHPEWWSLAIAVSAWAMILWFAVPMDPGLSSSHGHATHEMLGAALSHNQAVWQPATFSWFVMTVAMMFPMMLDPIRITASRSLWHRRHRAIVGFLAGYLMPWMLFGIVTMVLVAVMQSQTGVGPAIAASFAFAAAALWQLTSKKRRAVIACHRTMPLAPKGWRADRDCLRYGWMIGSSCLVSCWALMLACLMSGHSFPAMLCATSVVWIERNKPRTNQRLLSAFLAALAVIYAAVAYI
jgi:predicted metal-binding membrane protein